MLAQPDTELREPWHNGEDQVSGNDTVVGTHTLLDLPGRSDLASGFAAEQEEIHALIGSPNQLEAVTARFEKRDPMFAEV